VTQRAPASLEMEAAKSDERHDQSREYLQEVSFHSALNQVTLTVPGGAIYALLGSNVGQTQYDFTIPDFRLPSYQPDMGLPNGSMSIGFTTQ
jgi:hypothetical protein